MNSTFLEPDEEKTILKFLNYYNDDKSPENRVNLMLVKSVIYEFMMKYLSEPSFDSLTDTLPREIIYNIIESKLEKIREIVISLIKEQLEEEFDHIYDESEKPNFGINHCVVKQNLIEYFKQNHDVNFTNLLRSEVHQAEFRKFFFQRYETNLTNT